MVDALFHIDGAHFVPTELARGPWSPDAQHGGPPAPAADDRDVGAASRQEGAARGCVAVRRLRPPVGEWVCMASRTLPSPAGFGMAESALYDERGRVGRSVQSLLLESR